MDELGQLILGEAPVAKGPNLEGLHPVLSGQLQAANNAYREQYGKDLPITSGARTREEQQSLYDRAARGEKGIYMPVNPSKDPNKEFYHEGAVDISSSLPPEFAARMEKEFGLHRPHGAKDPVHWEVHPNFNPVQVASATTSDANPVASSSLGNFILGNAQISEEAPQQAQQAPQQAAPQVETQSAVAQAAERKFAPQQERTFTDYAKETGKSVASFLDNTIGAIIPSAVGIVAHPLLKAVEATALATGGKFDAAEATSAIVDPISKPFAKAFGIDENDPAYKREITNRVMSFVGENVGEGSKELSDKFFEKTGVRIPATDFEYVANLGIAAVTAKTAPIVGKGVKSAAGMLEDQFATKKGEAKPINERVEPGTAIAEPQVSNALAAPLTPDQVSQVVAAKNAGATPEALQTMVEQFNAKKAVQEQAPAPAENINTYKPDQNFSELKYAESGVAQPEQVARAEVLHRIDPNLKVDPNVIEGRGKDRASDYAVSKTDTPLGNLLSEKFKEEKTALNNYGERVIKDTGGTFGLDESANYKRGNGTIKYFQELENHFDKQINKIYADRDLIAKDIPVSGETIKTALSDPVTLELGDNAKLAKAASARLKQLGMMDAEGNMLPTNGFKAEQFRKWLNEKGVWDRGNAKMHSALKDAVDADVISTLDPNSSIYKDARDLYILKKNTLENPNGISSILEAEGPNKINRKIDIEKIPNAVAGMGIDQFTHILNTLDSAPKQLQAAAAKAKAEIKSQFANRAHEAFQRNANAGTKYLNENKEVMNRLFSPQEMAKFNDYNSAAHILKTDTGYPGAAVQTINVEQKLPTKIGRQLMKKGAASLAEIATGGHTLGIAGAVAHEAIGARQLAKDMKQLEKLHRENFEKKRKGFTNLKDIGK